MQGLRISRAHFIVLPSPLLLVLLLVIRGGDVSPNPGPGVQNRRYSTCHPCVHCDIGVTARSKAISCDSCDQWTHGRCSKTMTTSFYDDLCHSGADFYFLCNKCSASTLPFYDISHLSNISTNSHNLTSPDSSMSEGEDIFHELRLVRGRCKKNTIVSHLNINSLRNKFNYLYDLFSDKLVDILFISETKLDSTFKQGQFDVPGYKHF